MIFFVAVKSLSFSEGLLVWSFWGSKCFKGAVGLIIAVRIVGLSHLLKTSDVWHVKRAAPGFLVHIFWPHLKCFQTFQYVTSQNQSYFQTWLKHSRNSQPAMSQFLSISRLLLRRPVHRFGLQPRFCSSVGGEQQLKRETLFFDPEMQQLLLRLQGRDHTKVFSEKCQHTSKLNVPCRCLGQGSLRLIQTDLFISSWHSRSCSFWSKTLIPVHSSISDGLWYKMESSCLTGRSWKRLNRRWRRRCQRNCRCRRSWRRGTRPARSSHGHGCGMQDNLWFKVMDNPWWIDVLPITN